MSAPGAEARGEAASADAADARVPTPPSLHACVGRADAGPMAVETPETASDARRAVAPAADASWRAGFHQGYAHGGYARAGADLLRALASASAYVPSPTTGGDPGRERERRAVSFAAFPAREGALDAPPSSTPREDPPGGHDVESASRYGASVSHSEAWASALLEATRSQTMTLRPRKSRRTANFFDATAKKSRARNSHPTKINPSRDDDDVVDTKNKNANANALALTSVQAKTALSATRFLAALARRAYADASDASSFFFDDETVRSYGDCDPFVVSRIVDDAYETSVVLGYQGDGLLVAPELLEVNPPGFWTAAPFGPVGGRGKHVSVCVVAPIDDARAAAETAAEIEAQYEAMRLGTMTPLCERTVSSGEGDERSRHRTTSVFSYDPEKEASFDDALARVARAARASTRPGPFVAYVVGSSAAINDARLTTYAAARASEMDAEVCVDFALLPRDRLGRRRCSPAFAREKAVSAFAVAARRVLRFAETKPTTDDDAIDEDAQKPTRSTPLRSTRETVLAHGDAFGVSKKEPASLAAFEPPATIRRRRKSRESERDVRAAPSATLCAYAFSATRVAQEDGVRVEQDAENAENVCSPMSWLVATWTDDAGETFAVEARAFSFDAHSLASNRSVDGLAELADWLVGRTRAFAAAKTAAAGLKESSRRDEKEKETRKEKERSETLNADCAEDDARRLRRASFFFGDDTSDAPLTLTSDSSVGAGVVLVEVVPGLGTKARGNYAFAAAVASALAREEGDARENEETSSEKKSDHKSVIRRDDDAVLVGETRVVVLADDDETSARVSDSSTDGRATASSAPFALIGADGAVATATRGGASRASTEAPLNEKYRRRLAIATRVADARDFGGGDDDDDDFERKKTNATHSSSVAFAFAALARASRVARGASTGGGLAGCGSVRDLVPPHVAACASLAATLRDLERVAAGHDA